MDDSRRTGEQRVPPGQYVTEKWPVLSYGPTPEIDLARWRLRIFGAVAAEVELSWDDLQALDRIDRVADFHCVTRFSTLDNPWSGFSTREVLGRVQVGPDCTHVLVHGAEGYTTNLPLEDFLSEHALFVDRHNGAPLEPDHGGPLRLIVPHLYAWKSAKWVSGIEILEADSRGFWERAGYHTYGDPWREERFSSQEFEAAHQVRRKARDLGLTLRDG